MYQNKLSVHCKGLEKCCIFVDYVIKTFIHLIDFPGTNKKINVRWVKGVCVTLMFMVAKGILIISNTYVNIVLMQFVSMLVSYWRNCHTCSTLMYFTNINTSFSINSWFISNATNDSKYG